MSFGGGSASGDEELSVLADAIKKMDGMIGDFRPASPDLLPLPVLTSDPALLAVMEHCEELSKLIPELKERDGSAHPRECVPATVQELIISWLGGINPEETQQLMQDKDELLGQMVSLQQQLETLRAECSRFTAKVCTLEKRCVEKDQQLRDLNEDLRLTKVSLSSKEVELRHLQDQFQAGYRSERGGRQLPLSSQEPPSHRRSFRKALKKAFSRKDRHANALKGVDLSLQRPVNARADLFHSQSSAELAEWFKTIGLDMYSDLIAEKALTGERLAEMVSEDNSHQIVQIGILSTLHCKKLKLATLDALSPQSSPLSQLDHEWVGQWLVDIGLPQFHRMFLDARFDGRMLDSITLEDLKLLDVTVSFHVISIKRALQALRMCGYDADYLKDSCVEKSRHGSQKLLHWSAKDVARWICSIELDDYVGAMDTSGIHGAVMLLDTQFTSESLAKALGISPSKTLIRKHLSKKFMELIGPVAAQNKVDAMQSKTFIPLDPTEAPSGFSRNRSRSVGHRRSQDKGDSAQLLPISKFPAVFAAAKTELPSVDEDDLPLPTRYPTP